MKKMLFLLPMAFLAGCATEYCCSSATAVRGPEASKETQLYTDYGSATKSVEGDPMAYEWHTKNEAAINAATKCEVLASFVENGDAAKALLMKVQDAYKTDPVVLVQIAAVSQLVMCPTCSKAPARRAIWTDALVSCARGTDCVYRKLVYLDQLRWCAAASDRDAIASIADGCSDKAVKDMADIVLREVK